MLPVKEKLTYVLCSIIAETNNVLLSFDTVHFTWTHLNEASGVTGTPPSPRQYPQMTTFGDLLVIYGGKTQGDDRSCNDATFPNDLFVFNTTSKRWTELFPTGDLPTGRYQGSLVTMKDKIFLFGGRYFGSGCHLSESLYQLNFVNQTHEWHWTRLTSDKAKPGTDFPSVHFFRHAMTVADDKAYVFGGVSRGDDLYQFEMVDGEVAEATTFQHCANENENCACDGTARFGKTSPYAWIELAVTVSIMCSRDAFGGSDPASGQQKTCECRAADPTLVKYKMEWTKLNYAADIGGAAPSARLVR